MLVAVLLFAAPLLSRGQTDQVSEYQLKAAFLFSFAKFIDWPDKSFAGPQAPFSVCVIGQDPFGQALEQSLEGKSVGSRGAKVGRYPNARNLSEAQHCQIAFISASEKPHFREVIDGFRGTTTLLVGDSDGFAASGGAVEFMLQDNHVRFAINPEAADRAQLKVSSKLLALAQIVHDDPAKEKADN
jgi:hypothetical protein